jgi:ribulose-phosphate 3-epimerase
MHYQLSASILAADFAHLADEVNAVIEAGVDAIHFDVMDHHYVPNLTVGPVVCRSLRQAGVSATIDVHLMVENPEKYIQPFADAGADIVSFHPETVQNVAEVVQQIKRAGLRPGVVYNPDQAVDLDPALLSQLDMLLLMSVQPGFGGQSFIEDTLGKIKATRAWLDKQKSGITLAVDGGVNLENIAKVAQAGANYFVMGSAIFGATDYLKQVSKIKEQLFG